MKKFLLGFAFIASLAFMLTSCPGGSKAKNEVKGSNIALLCGENYTANTGNEITIKLASDTFKSAMAKDVAATGITIKAGTLDLSNYFKVKEATQAKADTVILYYVEPAEPAEGVTLPTATPVAETTLSVEIAPAALTGGKEGDGSTSVPCKVKFSVTANVSFNGTNILVVSFVEGAVVDSSANKITSLSLKGGAKVKKDADNANNKIDVTGWFKNLPAGIKAMRDKITGEGDGVENVFVTFVAEEAAEGSGKSATVATSNAVKVSVEIPAADLVSSTSSMKSADNLVFFVTRDPNAEDAAKKPKLTVSNGTISGKVGEAITEKVFTLTLDGDCVFAGVAGDAKAEINAAGLLNNFVRVLVTDGEGDSAREVEIHDWKEFVVAELAEDVEAGATSLKIKFAPKMTGEGNNKVAATAYSAFEGRLEALLPGSSDDEDSMGLLCNVYQNGNFLVSEKNADAKFVVTDERTMTLTDIVLTQAHRGENAAFDMVVTLTGDKLAADLAAEENVKSWFEGDAASVIDTAKVKVKANEDATTFTVSIVPTQGKAESLGEKVSPFAGTFTIPRVNLKSDAALSKAISVAVTFAD